MSDIRFTKVGGKLIEGYLGDNKEAEILFILKEPHTDNVKSNDGFWFRNVILDENRTATGKRYFNILGCLAEKLLNYNESKTELLKRCAYINLYPFSGLDRASENYKNVLNKFDEFNKTHPLFNNKMPIKINKDSSFDDIVQNRMSLINQIIMSRKTKYIVTVREIYNILSNHNYTKFYHPLEYGRNHKTKNFACYMLQNDIMLCEFWHPSYTWINYDYLNKAKKLL